MTNAEQEHLGVVVVGHVDAGKSTTTGHLLFKLGEMDPRTLEKLREEAATLGKATFEFAFYTDTQAQERERGITISCKTKKFKTTNHYYSVVDAPGHRDFIKNMITGTATADVAILMVPAELGGFEKTIQKADHAAREVEGQTRQHARICNLLGVQQLIVCVNKMDDKSVNFSEARY